ncbi:MAG: hypothetical protein ACREQM_11260 [Candidatus Dormibacteraceae bacterium]
MGRTIDPQLPPPELDTAAVVPRRRLQAELFGVDWQLHRFEPIRERLLTAGKDPSIAYRELLARRDRLAAELREGGPAPDSLDPRRPMTRLDEPLVAHSIAAARFDSSLGIFGFGSSGFVQMAPATDAVNVVAQGEYPHAGEIVTVPGSAPGVVTFSGDLSVGPDEVPANQYDPGIDYFWLRTWQYLVPFPPPPVLSRFTYRFDVSVLFNLSFGGGEGEVMSFVSLGETPHLTTGTTLSVDIDGGWPLVADLTQPGPLYNGSYGALSGQATVQRSFQVGAGQVPGVAVLVGAVAGLSMMSGVRLYFPGLGDSGISASAQGVVGRVAYSYQPELVFEP